VLGDDQGQVRNISLSCVETITKGTALLSIVYAAFKIVCDVIGSEKYIQRETVLLPSVGGVQLAESFISLTLPYVIKGNGGNKDRDVQALATLIYREEKSI